MNLRYIKQSYLDRLIINRSRIVEESLIEGGAEWLDEFFGSTEWWKESKVSVENVPELLLPDSRANQYDLENSILIYEWLKKLNVAQASDPRLWVYLSLITFHDYMKTRWPIETANIEERFFIVRKNSRSLVRNGISRLWWFAHLTVDSNRDDRYELTKVLLSYQDIQQSFLERSLGRCQAVRHGVLDFIRLHEEAVKNIAPTHKKSIQGLAKRVNQLGGVTLLDSLSQHDLLDTLRRIT